MQRTSSNSLSSDEEKNPQVMRLNGVYDLVKLIGEGSTCKVWLARSVDNPDMKYAIKIMSSGHMKQERSRKAVTQEVDILFSLDHERMVQMYEYGENGTIEYKGKTFSNRTYIVMEYVDGPLLFDLAKQMGSLGEELGRYFAKQLFEQLDYLNRQSIAHRDIKLENIIADKNMNLKLVDFGFATDKDIGVLDEFRGTQSYMAPEIRNGDIYDGREVDVFSMGVVLFTLVVGYFPF